MNKIFHMWLDITNSVIYICDHLVPILHMCEELVVILLIFENRVPIIHIWEKSNQFLTEKTNTYQSFTR